jgi:hypothetical protein
MTLIALPAHRYERQRWRNDAGFTREIARGGEAPDWRVSIAELREGCQFSRFEGCARQLILLSGAGLSLAVDEAPAQALSQPFASLRFSGDSKVAADLSDGPCEAFNLIYRPDVVDAVVMHRPLLGSMVLFLRPGQQWLLHLAGGHACLQEAELKLDLAQGDSAWLQGDAGRVRLEGGGDLLLVRIERRDA